MREEASLRDRVESCSVVDAMSSEARERISESLVGSWRREFSSVSNLGGSAESSYREFPESPTRGNV
jgi:hypothetical protein